MKIIKTIFSFLSICLIVILGSQCSSAQKIEPVAPLKIGNVYYQSWIAGIEGGGSGINLYIPIILNKNNIEMDSVYFQGKSAKLEFNDKSEAIGRFSTEINRKKDIIMSNEPYAEYGNQIKRTPLKTPFQLKDNQCVVSYKKGSEIKYFMVDSITKKPLLAFPSAPHNKE